MSQHHEALFRESGQRGGRQRARRLTAARRREIAEEGRMSAEIKKLGGLSKREFGEKYLGHLRQTDPDLAEFMTVAWRAPSRVAVRMQQILTAGEWALVLAAWSAAAADPVSRKEVQ